MLRKFSFYLLLILFSCQEDEEGPRNPKYAELRVVSGDNQVGTTGATLTSEIVLQVTPKSSVYKKDRFFFQTKGDGQLAASGFIPATGYSDATGKFRTIWTLGCRTKNQTLSIYLYYADSCILPSLKPCIFVDSVTINATASTPHGWNKACGLFNDVDHYNTKLRYYNNQVYAVNGGTLYKAVMGEGMTWEKIPDVPVNDIFDFGFTSSGRIYALTENNGVYTANNFQDWTSQSTGILDPRYPLSLLVEDSTVYVSFLFDGLYRIRPAQSDFWKKY